MTKILPTLYFLMLCIFSAISIATPLEYVGEGICKSCHLKEFQQWQNSDHDLAMQEANEKSVLGDFNHSVFLKDSIRTTFFKIQDRFMVNTEGEDGKLHDFEISYTFGVYPLQQYMIKFPKGKVQVLDIAWDSRKKEEGGQRWFSLHPNDSVKAGDVLHWTGQNLNWNYMCADCHSTNLKKNYSEIDKSYHTTWDAIDVSCEACHGPSSKHVTWAKGLSQQNKVFKKEQKHHKNVNNGLTIDLLAATKRKWIVNEKTQKPELDSSSKDVIAAKRSKGEIELCAKCHSRRAQFDDEFTPGDNFRDHYLPALLTDSLYYPDGKIKDEVYVYGSFKQSRMYEAGVTCSDCHNPHDLKLKLPQEKVCLQCHLSTKYENPKHHFHKEGSTGSSCVSCHMPEKIYMGVDERNDHSFRIPRPDVAEQLSIPDACTNCHKDKSSGWSANAIEKWPRKNTQGYQQFSSTLHSIEEQSDDILTKIYEVLLTESPNIVKATVIGHLGEYPSRQTLMTALQMLRSKDADIRRQALRALERFPIKYTLKQIFPMLKDPIKIVRMEAARILSAVPSGTMESTQKNLLNEVTEEYRQSLLFTSERAESQVILAQLYSQLGQLNKAERSFEKALIIQSQYVPTYVNYATFLQHQGKEDESYEILEKGLKQTQSAAIYHSLGLWYVRNKQIEGASEKMLDFLRIAAKKEPDNARYQYVYAVAIGDKEPNKAIEILLSSLNKHSGNLETLSALSSYYKTIKDEKNALKYYKKIETIRNYTP